MFDFGKWLKSARKEQQITQFDLATDVGITNITLSYIENNKRDPSYLTMLAIIDSLGYEFEIKKKGA